MGFEVSDRHEERPGRLLGKSFEPRNRVIGGSRSPGVRIKVLITQPCCTRVGLVDHPDSSGPVTGLMQMLDREEIAAVMAHELAHVKNRDTLVMTVTATLAGAISMLGNFAFFFGGNRGNGQSNAFVALIAMIVAQFIFVPEGFLS